MKTLLLETSTEQSLIALVSEKTTILHPMEGGPSLSKNIAQVLDGLLQLHGFMPDQIVVGEGPGSLTGVRVGMALARALAFGWQIPCKTFCSLKLFTPDEEGNFAILVDAKMGRMHMLRGKRSLSGCAYEECITRPASEIKDLISHVEQALSPHPEKCAIPCRQAAFSKYFIQT